MSPSSSNSLYDHSEDSSYERLISSPTRLLEECVKQADHNIEQEILDRQLQQEASHRQQGH